MSSRRLFVAAWRAPLLNLVFGALPGAVALLHGPRVLAGAYWLYLAMAAIFLAMALGSVRWMAMGPAGLAVMAIRFRLGGIWLRVEMDYDEIDRVEVIGRPFSLFSAARLQVAALRSDDGRRALLAGRDFAFSPACLAELARRVEAARGRRPRLDLGEAGDRPARRSPWAMAAALALAAVGVWILFTTLGEGVRRARTRAAGEPARAEILALPERPGQGPVTLRLEQGGPRRRVQVGAAWQHGRKVGHKVAVKVDPRPGSRWFLLPGEVWSGSRGYLWALLLFAFGARFFIRSATLPAGTKERLEKAWAG